MHVSFKDDEIQFDMTEMKSSCPFDPFIVLFFVFEAEAKACKDDAEDQTCSFKVFPQKGHT